MKDHVLAKEVQQPLSELEYFYLKNSWGPVGPFSGFWVQKKGYIDALLKGDPYLFFLLPKNKIQSLNLPKCLARGNPTACVEEGLG